MASQEVPFACQLQVQSNRSYVAVKHVSLLQILSLYPESVPSPESANLLTMQSFHKCLVIDREHQESVGSEEAFLL